MSPFDEPPDRPGATGGVTLTEGADGHDGVDGHDGAGGSRTPVSLPAARMSDPHMQDGARYPRRVEGIVGLFFLIGIAGVAAFGGAYWAGASTQWLAGTLAVGLFAIGFGVTAWGKYLMPQGPFVEDRHPLRSTDEQREAMAAAVVERGGTVVKRRKVLGGLLGAGLGIFGVVALFPLLRSLGPAPGDTLYRTNWKKGRFLVDGTGRRLHRTDLEVGGIVTVFPGGSPATANAQAVDQTVLIRVQLTDLVTLKGRTSWGPEGYIAYSKVCTHLGCPVGLYEQELELLVCPCHQSMFNVRNGAFPQFGPAPRPLPQLPLYIDGTGFLRSQAGYNQPVGPGFWSRPTVGNGKASNTAGSGRT